MHDFVLSSLYFSVEKYAEHAIVRACVGVCVCVCSSVGAFVIWLQVVAGERVVIQTQPTHSFHHRYE
jgi:hypothetical protein